MVGGGHLDYYAAVAPIYPLLGLALLVESRLSAQTRDTLQPQSPENPWGSAEYKQFYWRVLPVILGLGVGVFGVYAALKALVDGHTTLLEYVVADGALGLQGAALVVLLVYHVYDMTGKKSWVAFSGGTLVAGLLAMVAWGITHP